MRIGGIGQQIPKTKGHCKRKKLEQMVEFNEHPNTNQIPTQKTEASFKYLRVLNLIFPQCSIQFGKHLAHVELEGRRR